MKRFNLEAALRGEPVITRDGREVSQITLFDVKSKYNLCAVAGGILYQYDTDGKSYPALGDEDDDLFMASKKRIVWVNLYPNSYAYYYDTEADADDYAARVRAVELRIGNKAFPLEIEE